MITSMKSIEMLKIQPYMALSNLLLLTLLWAGAWTRWSPEIPSHLKYSVILWTAASLLASLRVEPVAQSSNFISTCNYFRQGRVIPALQDSLRTGVLLLRERSGRRVQSHFWEKTGYDQSCVYGCRLAYKYLVMLDCVRKEIGFRSLICFWHLDWNFSCWDDFTQEIF